MAKKQETINEKKKMRNMWIETLELTALGAEVNATRVDSLVSAAREHKVAGVCVAPLWLPRVVDGLLGTTVKPVTVVNFPHGDLGVREMRSVMKGVVQKGAQEVDVVAPLGLLKDGEIEEYRDVVAEIVMAAGDVPVKMILETAALDRVGVLAGAHLAMGAGAKFLKTSTGFHPAGGATVEAVSFLRHLVGERDFAVVGVKASGGIKTQEDVLRMIEAGANRIGTSAVEILVEQAAVIG